MLEALFRYIARVLSLILAKWADPQLESKLAEYNERAARADARAEEALAEEAQSNAIYRESVNRRAELDRLIQVSHEQETQSAARLAASQTRVKEIEKELADTQGIIDRQSNRDSVRADV